MCIHGRIFNKNRKFHTRRLNTMLWRGGGDINHLIFGIFRRNDDTRNTSWIQLGCVSIRNQIKVRLGSYRGWSSCCCCWGCGWGCGGDINWFVDEDWDYIRHGTLIGCLKIKMLSFWIWRAFFPAKIILRILFTSSMPKILNNKIVLVKGTSIVIDCLEP